MAVIICTSRLFLEFLILWRSKIYILPANKQTELKYVNGGVTTRDINIDDAPVLHSNGQKTHRNQPPIEHIYIANTFRISAPHLIAATS